jgi:hypothetical protein
MLKRYREKYRKKTTLNPNFNKEHYSKNKNSIRLNQKKYYLKTRDVLRQKAFKILANGKKIGCANHDEWGCCQDPFDLDILQIDHIKNDGAEHRKEIKGGLTFYRWIINNPKVARARLQIICANAQWKKRRLVEKKERKRLRLS